MAITAFTGWSTTAALNVDLNSIPLDGASMTANQVDDAFREMMKQLKAGVAPETATTGQVQFPATQNPSTGANVLDDYEEGTWTINMTFNTSPTGVTYSANTGSYIKIGKKVTLFGRITLTSNGTGVGQARITNLPFTSDSIGASVPGAMRLLAGGSAATGIYPTVENGTTTMALYIPGAVSDAGATDTNVTDTFSADFCVTYQASA
jgi:hypothetical protein